VAEEAVRAAHAAHCAALALRGKAAYEETARFLVRRAAMLLALTESLVTESRCEERLRMLACQEVLEGMKQAEEQLLNKVKLLLSRTGVKLQMVKLLEQEALISRASLARLQLALMQPEQGGAKHEPDSGIRPPQRRRN
jgi:hypothetical protein